MLDATQEALATIGQIKEAGVCGLSHFGQEQVSFDRSSSKFVPACKRIDVHETVELCCARSRTSL